MTDTTTTVTTMPTVATTPAKSICPRPKVFVNFDFVRCVKYCEKDPTDVCVYYAGVVDPTCFGFDSTKQALQFYKDACNKLNSKSEYPSFGKCLATTLVIATIVVMGSEIAGKSAVASLVKAIVEARGSR